MIQADVVILGAGPGGAATALRLSYLGISCVLIDKADFPRDKICGDAISGKVTTLLNRLDPAILRRFNGVPIQTDIWGITFFAPNRKKVRVPFKPAYQSDPNAAPGYVSKRMDFDHFLIEEVKQRDNIQLYLKTEITGIERSDRGYRLTSADGNLWLDTRMLVVANGAHSAFSRSLPAMKRDPRHYAVAVRAYFRGVQDMDPGRFIEMHFIKDVAPGYFWIFPLPNGQVNAGLGMRSDIQAKKQVNLRMKFNEIVQTYPGIGKRFSGAELLGKVYGYGLPLGSRTRRLSGDHYLLVGDAGHLIDPLTGEGIGNAFYSGFIAAELIEQCLEAHDFSAERLRAYDVRVQRVLGSEMKLSYRMQQTGQYPILLNGIANILDGNLKLMNYLSAMYTDFDLREQLVKPGFWLKMLWMKRGE